MTQIRLGYVAMSMLVKNCSPSQTMTFKQFSSIADKEAAIRKLERIAVSNLENCLRLLKHNRAHNIHFFRFSSRLIPLADHPEVGEWDYMTPIRPILKEIGVFVRKYNIRVDFHPDHFVLLNSSKEEILKASLITLRMHYRLLKAMGVDPTHRCVLHVGGGYKDHEAALEQFIENWSTIPTAIQKMIILENDDTTFDVSETLYLCEKLQIPMVFDLHHHDVHHGEDVSWEKEWDRIVATWEHSPLPMKMHISSPRNEKDIRAHADYVDVSMFMRFLSHIKGTVDEVHCMIEAKHKDRALLQLAKELRSQQGITFKEDAMFVIE